MGRMISPSGSHGRRLHGSLRILALVAVTLACPIATTSDAGANDDLKKPLASREVPSQSATAEHGASVQVRVSDTYGKLPLFFEANQGQTDPQVKFLSRGPSQWDRASPPGQPFPTTPGAFQTTFSSSFAGFVTKLDPAGTVVYSTFLSG